MPAAPADLLARLLSDTGPFPRTVLIVPHPDDEVIGASTLVRKLGKQLSMVHVTDGAPVDGKDAAMHGFAGIAEYAAARRVELQNSVAVAGMTPDQLHELHCPDQQVTYKLVEMVRKFTALCDQTLKPEVLLVQPYEGGHPDHDSSAFIGHAAARLMKHRPALVEMTGYHMGANERMVFDFLPGRSSPVLTVTLTPEQREAKTRMLAAFVSQPGMLKYFPVDVELFRLAPDYDFTALPHEGKLHYENYPWGSDGKTFRYMAGQALKELGLA